MGSPQQRYELAMVLFSCFVLEIVSLSRVHVCMHSIHSMRAYMSHRACQPNALVSLVHGILRCCDVRAQCRQNVRIEEDVVLRLRYSCGLNPSLAVQSHRAVTLNLAALC